MTYWVLMKAREPGRGTDAFDAADAVQPHCICSSIEDVRTVVDAIANHKDNRRYRMVETSENLWKMGPEGDEGFFGHRPMRFWALRVSPRGALKGLATQT